MNGGHLIGLASSALGIERAVEEGNVLAGVGHASGALQSLSNLGQRHGAGIVAGGIHHALSASNHFRHDRPLEGSRDVAAGIHLLAVPSRNIVRATTGSSIFSGAVNAWLCFERGDMRDGGLAVASIPATLAAQYGARQGMAHAGRYATVYGRRLHIALRAMEPIRAAASFRQAASRALSILGRVRMGVIGFASGPAGVVLVILDLALIGKDLFERGLAFTLFLFLFL